MNVAIVCYPTYGGSGVLATELGIALSKKGHNVHFVSSSMPARLDQYYDNISFHEVNNIEYPLFEYTPYETALASKLVDVIEFQNIDILHVHYAVPHASAAYMTKQILQSKGIHIPFITTLHGTDITLVGNNPAYAPVVEFSINNSDGVTAVSESLAKDTYAGFNIDNDIEVIYNFIDTSRFSRVYDERHKLRLGNLDDILLVHISNFRPVKRIGDVLKIFQLVAQDIENVKLVMVGDGPERQNAEKFCREHSICDKVTFLGKIDSVETVLSQCDVLLQPSEKESFGLAALEAMACGVPVVSSDAGGIPEVNIDGETGFVYPIGDTIGMSEGVKAIVKDKATWQQFSTNSLAKAKEFDIANIIPQYEQYYEAVIEKSRIVSF